MPAGQLLRVIITAAVLGCPALASPMPAQAGAALVKGDLIVADARALGGGALIEVDPETGAETVLSSNEMAVNDSHKLFAYPFTLTVSQAGRIFVANTENLGGTCKGGCGGVIEVNPETGAESVLSSNAMAINASSQYFDELTGITVDPEGNIVVTSWDQASRTGEVIEVNTETGKERLVSSNSMSVNASSEDFVYPQGIVTDAAGNIFVADAGAFGGHGGVIEVNPATGKESEISADTMPVNASSQFFHAVSQLVFNQAGNLLIADWCPASQTCGGVIEVNPETGKQTLVSSNEMPINASSQLFKETTSLAVQSGGRIVEVQENGLGGSCDMGAGCGGLVYVDPATGKETELSANNLAVNAASEYFVEPFDVVEYGATPWPGPGPSNGDGDGGTDSFGGSDSGVGQGGPAHGSPRPPAEGGPIIAALSQAHKRWIERNRRHSTHIGYPAHGTVFSFTLNQAATVKLTFSSTRPGRFAGGVCKPPARHDGHGRSCTYSTAIGTLTVDGHAGTNKLSFTGHLSRRRMLRPGRYQLSVSATSAHGESTTARTLSFTILS
ncbi:MAG TPA: hypothetical protein VED41_04590 [Solirubrobacteraceae bacterium]|nr:hypothetical protein [Solirubrobacteraceae bacterium]